MQRRIVGQNSRETGKCELRGRKQIRFAHVEQHVAHVHHQAAWSVGCRQHAIELFQQLCPQCFLLLHSVGSGFLCGLRLRVGHFGCRLCLSACCCGLGCSDICCCFLLLCYSTLLGFLQGFCLGLLLGLLFGKLLRGNLVLCAAFYGD